MDFLHLPYDIKEEVFSCLDAFSLHKLRRVCSAWNELVLNCTGLRKIVQFHCRLSATTLWGWGTLWKSIPMALTACLFCETKILVLRIEIQHLTTAQALQLCKHPFRQDWICALFFTKESYVNAKNLHTIIFQGNGKHYWECEFHTHLRVDLFPSELPASVRRVVLCTIGLETVSHDDQAHLFATLSGIVRKKVLYKSRSTWPWASPSGYERVKILASWLGPMDVEMDKVFVENLQSYPDPDGVIRKELQWFEKRFGNAQLAESFAQLNLAVLRQCQPWIQHLIHSRVAKTAHNYKIGLALTFE